jgi:predicted nucleotidyltransferase
MSSISDHPTPFPDVNEILQELVQSIQSILGCRLIGMYLEGSLANGDFDLDRSDIDFVVVTDQDVSEDTYLALQAMHTRINQIGSGWAIQLEGSYISRHALRRFDPQHAQYPNIERGYGECLKMAYHDEPWIIHRYILRERGIMITGPDPKTLIDPVSPHDLRRAMLPLLHGWVSQMLHDPDEIIRRGYPSSYIVLTLCRILYTLQLGDVVSKPKAARWVQATVSESWKTFIDRVWVELQYNQPLTPDTEAMDQTLDFIRYTLERSQHIEIPAGDRRE